MPEFEEPEVTTNSQENYTPSTDASKKPRTRRRSGGFKTELPTTDLSIGEVDPVKALKKEKLSGVSKPAPERKREKFAPREDAPRKRAENRSPRGRRGEDERPRGNAQPSPETLAAIATVEARLAERKKGRDVRRAEREKNRPARSEKKPQPKKKGQGKKKQSGGIIASILSFFGLGPKEPVKKKGSGQGKPSGNRGQGGRPRGQGGNRGGQGGNRGGGQNRRGGQGRRSGGGGNRGRQNRRNDNRNRSEQS